MKLSTSIPPVILHIPHASTHVPDDVKSQFCISQADLDSEIKHMTDHFTDWLVEPLNLPTSQKVVAPVSRLVIDMERFVDDEQEVMAKIGMGVIYEKGSKQQKIRHGVTKQQREHLLERFYTPHHNSLIEKTQQCLSDNGYAVVLDIHSYPSKTSPYEINQTQQRPQICLGTCDFHTPTPLVDAAIQAFSEQGFEVALNEPFAGTLIPTPFWQQNANVMGLMIEIRRDLYINESNAERLNSSEETRAKICEAINSIISFCIVFFRINEWEASVLTKELIEAYKQAKYIVHINDKPYRIKVGEPCPALDAILQDSGADTAYFITPENPFSMTLSEQENKLRHERFVKIINHRAYAFYKGYGTNEDDTWPREQSYLIVCDKAQDIHQLASSFGQNGIIKLQYQNAAELLVLSPLQYQAI